MGNKETFRKFATKHLGMHDAVLDQYAAGIEGMTRSVIEKRPKSSREIDVFAHLIGRRIIFLGTPVDSNIANTITAQLLFLESVAPKKEITLYINSPGGSVHDGLAIYDTMQYISSPVGTTCVGLAASMGAVLLAGGEKGRRFSLPHARVMIHQPLGRAQGQMADMKIAVQEIINVGEDLYEILARHTGQSLAVIRRDANRDFWMRSSEAKAYGLVDGVLHKK